MFVKSQPSKECKVVLTMDLREYASHQHTTLKASLCVGYVDNGSAASWWRADVTGEISGFKLAVDDVDFVELSSGEKLGFCCIGGNWIKQDY